MMWLSYCQTITNSFYFSPKNFFSYQENQSYHKNKFEKLPIKVFQLFYMMLSLYVQCLYKSLDLNDFAKLKIISFFQFLFYTEWENSNRNLIFLPLYSFLSWLFCWNDDIARNLLIFYSSTNRTKVITEYFSIIVSLIIVFVS